MESQLVIFELNKETYGIDIATVESIIKVQTITAVPHAPTFIEGVTNLRGTILPVIDLRKRFGLPPLNTTKDTRIVIVEINGNTIGMIVDAVNEVIQISTDAVEPPSPLVTTVESAFITGIAKLDERLVILLDLDRILTIQEQAKLQEIPTI